MIPRLLTTLFLLLSIAVYPSVNGGTTPVPLILDTDISSDVDDVGAVAVLHALADQGKVEILAMMASSGDPWSIGCLDALNTFLGRPDIPIGRVNGESIRDASKYTRTIASQYPHDTILMDTPSAVDLYRKILAGSADHSVVVVSIGYLTNLHNLLLSPPDRTSPLSGIDLVKKKITKWVCMGGRYPSGREWNFFQDGSAAHHTVKLWPGAIYFIGYESGLNVLTGAGLRETSPGNPVRRSYDLYNQLSDRPSWDQLAVLFAVWNGTPAANGLWETLPGKNHVLPDGSNRWNERSADGHFYLRLMQPPEKIAATIEELMRDALESNPASQP